VGNTASHSVNYDVTYQLCVLFDQTKAYKLGSTVPIKLQLCDAGSSNMSTADIVLNATGLTKKDNTASRIVEDAGNSNPDSNFRFDAVLAGYVLNLSTKGLSTAHRPSLISGSSHVHTPSLVYNSIQRQFVLGFVKGDDYLPPTLFGAQTAYDGNSAAISP
jgi:hypothetical protein